MATKVRLEVRDITPVVGAVIDGVDLSAPLDTATIATIRETVLRQGAVFFRDQDITREHTAALMRHFGPLSTDPFTKMADMPDLPLELCVHDMPTYGNSQATAVWHMDSTVAPAPAAFLSLRALQLPPGGGGDTCWGSMYAAYETLSAAIRDLIDGLSAEHSGTRTLALMPSESGKHLQQEMRSAHPVVRVNPDTGRKALFVNALWTDRIAGLSQHESDGLLAMLNTHAARPEFTMRWQWRVGDLVLWDNRSFQHYAVRDYEGLRVLQKAYVRGDRPYGPRQH
jgi:taurine dioxygenase